MWRLLTFLTPKQTIRLDRVSPDKLRPTAKASERPSSSPCIYDAGAGRTRTGPQAKAKTGLLPHTSHGHTSHLAWATGVAPSINHHSSPPQATALSLPSPPSSSRHPQHPKNLTGSRPLALASSPRRREGRPPPCLYNAAGAEVLVPLIRSPRSTSVSRLRLRRVRAIPPRSG